MSTEPKIVICGNESCAYCAAARMWFTKKGMRFDDIKVSGDAEKLAEMERLSGSRSVRQIFINDQLVGGFYALCALENERGLERLLGQ